MAVTWAASAPHATAVKEVGTSYGVSGSSVFANLGTHNGKRRVLTKLTATGTYTTGGDAAPLPSIFGLKEIFRAYIVASATTNVKPSVNGQDTAGVPTFLTTTTTAPKVQYFDAGVEASAGVTLTGDVFHVIFEGI
jgi:hypothetical protein